ncbi:hypothetical protein PMAYCL1PPCAC_26713, partial [Pristionchus mayeri]
IMPPKKASTKEPKIIPDFEKRKEEVLEEVEERKERVQEWIAQRREMLLMELRQVIDGLDPGLLRMTVGEFIAMPVTIAEDKNDENEDVRTAREMTVENQMAIPNQIQQTAMRPQTAARVLELRTPAGKPFKCPSLITPRVGGPSMTTREIRPDEVGFSASGSPIVLGDRRSQPDSAVFDDIHQMINADEAVLSPNSREIVRNLKGLIQRRQNLGDPV